ncbi:lipoprotein 17-related variable surface protein [Mycoplasma sp. ATU-Cv-508]|uniref:lipoprotein 17-related variable surface protein n=1 Tax=Mycoplasma sp. ATU-Cv-508 TaxID=2048001 RepID=UPI000FDE688B
MRKFTLLSTFLGLGVLSATSLVSCTLGFGSSEQNRHQTPHKSSGVKKSYLTVLNDTAVLDFKKGHLYSPAQMGLAQNFSEQHQFEVKVTNDLTGQLQADLRLKKVDGSSQILKTGLTISGFQKIRPSDFFARLRGCLPPQMELTTSLEQKLDASFLTDIKSLAAKDLGIDDYFDFRQAEHKIKILRYEESAGQLEIILSVTLGGEQLDLPLKVVGLKSNVDPKVVKRLDAIMKVLEKFKDAETTHSNKLPSTLMQRIGDHDFYDQLGVGKFPEIDKLPEGIQIAFEKGVNTSDLTGQIELKTKMFFEFDNQVFQKSKTVMIRGFLNSEKVKDRTDQTRAQKIKNYLRESFVWKTKHDKLPASAAKKAFVASQGRLTNLGLPALPSWLFANAQIHFTAKVADDQKGTLTLLAEIKVGKTKLETNVLVEGFYRDSGDNLNKNLEITPEFNKLVKQIDGLRTSLNDRLPSSLTELDGKLTLEKLGLQPLPVQPRKNIKFEFSIVETDDDLGTIKLLVKDLTAHGNEDTLITIKGYQTNSMYLEKIFATKFANLAPTSFSDKLPSELKNVGNKVTFQELGLASSIWTGLTTI